MKSLWSVAALGLSAGILLVFLTSPAEARHRIRMVENSYFNPTGGVNPRLYGINIDWESSGAGNIVCSDYGPNYSDIPTAIRDAIASWEGVLSGTQFYPGCPGGRSATWFLRRSVSAGYPCSSTDWACTFHYRHWDPNRKAEYIGSTIIWINDSFSHTYSGLRYVAGHELGHVFGQDEAYVDGDVTPPLTFLCNSARSSVLDMGVRSGNQITGPCAGDSYSPTSWDISETRLTHQLNPMTNITSSVPSSGVIRFNFFEPTWADSGYRMRAYRLVGSDWVWTGQEWYHTDQVGSASQYNATYYIKGSQPSGYYWVCGWSHNYVLGNQYYRCSPTYHYLSP